MVVFSASPVRAAGRQVLHFDLPAAVTNSSPVGQLPGTTNLDLAIGLPWRDPETLTNLLREIYDPTSVNFRHFLTPDEFAARFGPTEKDYQAVIAYAQANGFTVTATHPNRMLLDVRGSVGVIETAFKVRMSKYQHPTEKRRFYAPDAAPSLALAVPVLGISGLNDYALPRPRLIANLITNASNAAPNAGSGPGGTYAANDFRAAYVPGWLLTGTGQKVGLLQFDGYHSNDIAYYESRAGLPSVTLSNVLLNGVTGNPSGGGGEVEVSLDIESAISMAPGLSMVMVYEGANWHDILNRMATDNLAKQLSCSWYIPGGGPDQVADQIWQQMAAQGQSFFNASGDADAYTGPIDFPGDTPYITQVGGTTLTTSGAGGRWVSETVWNWGGGTGSGGGVSTSYPIPSWQTNINLAASQGSTTKRNTPDVALTADNVYVRANNQDYNVGGTSCAAPLWAGFASLINQVALQNGEPTIGFVNPTVYALGRRGDYTVNFHDITTGNNEKPASPTKFAAVTGYDLCTGWGTPAGSNLLYVLGVPEALKITPGAGFTFTGPVGGPFNSTAQSFLLTNNAGAPLNWSLACTSTWLNVAPTGGTLITGGPPETVIASLTSVASNLPAAGYPATIWFTNLGDHFVQSRQFTLAVVSPPVITQQPASQAVFEGAAAAFTVGTGSNALMFYQWQQDNGSYLTNLVDGGKLSGAATSTLTVSNVSAANAGAYYVTVSNAAGTATSAAAFLTIIPWRPVITQQPVSQTVLPGAPATFTVAAVGTHPFSYGWQLNGTNLTDNSNVSGSGTPSLTIGNVTAPNTGNYTVVVSNALGTATSSAATLNLIPVTAPGVTLSTLSSFTGGNASGEFPYGPLVVAGDGNLYGTTIEGGVNGYGTIFRVTTNGVVTMRTVFHGIDGEIPYAGLALGRDGLMYGTASQGGVNGYGTIFRIATNGILPNALAYFNELNGYFSVAGLVQGSDTNFYGTTVYGGAFGYGNVFRVTPSGFLTNLHDFNYTDGGYPSSVLIQTADGSFYGTTENGGPTGWGTVFQITPAGRLTTVYAFHGQDGGVPVPGLVQDTDGSLCGTTYSGGTNYSGSIFRIAADGTFTNLYSFTGGTDGSNPYGGLLLAADGNFYGTTLNGGSYNVGTVFRIDRSGALTTLAVFDGFQGANPSAALAQGADGFLYGTTANGGASNVGTVFRIRIDGPLQLTSQPVNQLVYYGGTATFSVATVGSQPVTYQWQKSGTNLVDGSGLSGTASRQLTITNVNFGNAGVYSLIASNTYGSVTSSLAFLEIMISPPLITAQPVSQTVLVGSTVTFTVGAVGDQPFYYQWTKNGANLVDGGNLSGSTAGTLTVHNATAADDGAYAVVVSDDFYWAASADADLTVLPIIQTAYTLTTLRSFTGGSDGGKLNGLAQGANGSLYGTAQSGGANGYGTTFRITTSGTLSTLFSFNQVNGAYPYAGVVQAADGNFYGTTRQGGSASAGSVFKLSPALSVLNLYSFTGGTDGYLPTAGLIQGSDGNLYGTTYEGGIYGDGAVFKITTNGLLTTLYSFKAGADGYGPWAGLVQGTDGNFYGTTEYGGIYPGAGTVFRVTPSGTLTTLHTFNGGSDGAYPTAGLIQGVDGRFYGTTSEGGTHGNGGTAFNMAANGVVTILHQFGAGDGANPAAALLQGSDGNLYGTTESGGLGGYGTAFKLTTNGALTTLAWFIWSNGAYPAAPLIQATDGNFYGTTSFGGTSGYGTVFRLTGPLPPQVVLQPTNQTVYTGMNATFKVAAIGTVPLIYQWRLNGVDLADVGNLTGSGTSSLTITNASVANAGTYSVLVTNLLGSTTSTGAVLTVASPPMISNVICNPDGSVTLNLSTAPFISSRILTTTNLAPPVTWQPIFTNVPGSDGAWQFTDLNASNYPARFYRSSTP